MQPEDPLDSLAQRADEVKNLLPFASRPFVIELAGTPKSGKSTSVETLACPQIGAELLTADRDFEPMRDHLGLRLAEA